MYCIAVDFMRLLRDGELCLPAHNVPFCSFIGLALHWPLVNSQSLEMILFPKSHLASSPTGTQVTEDKLVSVCVGWGRPKWCVCVCVCVCVRGHLHWSRVLGALKPLLATSMGPGLLG